jgi:hypothetical protein
MPLPHRAPLSELKPPASLNERVHNLASCVSELRHWTSLSQPDQQHGLATPLKCVMLSAAIDEVQAAATNALSRPLSTPRLRAGDGFPAAGSRLPVTGMMATPAQPEACTECAVCHGAVRRGECASTLPCGHIYHQQCLGPWLAHHDTCPTCRAPVDFSLASAAKELTRTASDTVTDTVTVDSAAVVLRLAERLAGSMARRLRVAAESHNDQRCMVITVLEVNGIRESILGRLSCAELWRLRAVSKSFSRFCVDTLGDTEPVLVAGGIGAPVGQDGNSMVAQRTADIFEW